MSKPARDWLKRQKIDDKGLMSILGVLASVEQDGVCQITQPRIAEKMDVADRTVRRLLATLEALGVVHRSKQSEWGKRGRASDLIYLSLDLDFNISREAILSAKSGDGLTGQNGQCPNGHFAAKLSGAPTTSHIMKRIYGKDGAEIHSCVGRVFFENDRQLWRAKLKLDGVELDLGRHEARDLAEAEIYVSIQEIEFTVAHPAGTPIHPKINPSLQDLQGASLADFLFGTDQKRASRAADRMGSGRSSPSGVQGQRPCDAETTESQS